MNNFKVEIFNNITHLYDDYTEYAIFSPKFANILDEQLDEATITLKGVEEEIFQPTTFVQITIYNNHIAVLNDYMVNKIKEQKDNEDVFIDNFGNQRTILCYQIANDTATEILLGGNKKVYEHQLYLIEPTKALEGFYIDSLVFSNTLGNSFIDDKIKAFVKWDGSTQSPTGDIVPFNGIANSSFIVKSYLKGEITFPTADEIKAKETNVEIPISPSDAGYKAEYLGVYDLSGKLQTNSLTFNAPLGSYIVKYSFYASSAFLTTRETVEYSISVIENRYPIKKYTIRDVCERLFDIAEPLRYNPDTNKTETARFFLDIDDWLKYKDIISPEFTFTKCSLREALQQVGGHIHGEPRVRNAVYYDDEKRWKFSIGFDDYGAVKYSHIKEEEHDTAVIKADINQYCTGLDSPTSNLVNSLDWLQNVVVEPFEGGYRSLRTDNVTARLTEDNSTYIPTSTPIYKVGYKEALICRYIPNIGEVNYDLTPYLYEQADYDLLSSYKGDYPYVKAYALSYTIGQPNIRGLFFKVPNAVNPIFENYAIINILRAVTGNNGLKIDENDIFKLAFQVSYLPIYDTRIRTYKQHPLTGLPRLLAYNQGANLIESRYYGEHLKGVVERLGNIEKTYTYNLAYLSQIPKAGTRFDDEYFISNVNYELNPQSIRCTIGLSKNFNRKSEYVGINSENELWQVSKTRYRERESVIPTYIVAGTKPVGGLSGNDLNQLYDNPATILFNTFKDNISGIKETTISSATINYSKTKQPDFNNIDLTMPVIASASGNSMQFTFRFQDNYSAGQQISKEIDGTWANYIPYGNYYGRFYYLKTKLNWNEAGFGSTASATPETLPLGTPHSLIKSVLTTHILYRKDSREIPQVTHEIAVVSSDTNLIIGSGLCRNCKLVNKQPDRYELYGFTDEILNVIDSKVNIKNGKLVDVNLIIEANKIKLPTSTFPFKSWAIVTKQRVDNITVEDDDGNIITQSITTGGELVIGQNHEQLRGQTIYFGVKEKLYD